MNDVQFLVLSNTYDFSTDLVCHELKQRNKAYLRLNRDRFADYRILYSLDDDALVVEISTQQFRISTDHLHAIYFRAPVFLRGTGKPYTIEEQLYRNQWSSFIRNLVVFDKAVWINHPAATYLAENKLYQLKIARSVGLQVPVTYVGNMLPRTLESGVEYIVKSLDAALFFEQGQELFTYSSAITGDELRQAEIQDAPVILQECLKNKTDLRITVIGDKLFSTAITCDGNGIEGDWRKHERKNLTYTNVVLPDDIRNGITELMAKLNLHFGGVDLAFANGKYYFIEVNPTGEWGWLTQVASLPLHKEIVNYMTNCVMSNNE